MRLFCRRPLQIIVVTCGYSCFCEQSINKYQQFLSRQKWLHQCEMSTETGQTWMEPRCVWDVQQFRRSCKMHTHQRLAKALFLASVLVEGTPSSTDTSSVFQPLSSMPRGFVFHEEQYTNHREVPSTGPGTMDTGMAFKPLRFWGNEGILVMLVRHQRPFQRAPRTTFSIKIHWLCNMRIQILQKEHAWYEWCCGEKIGVNISQIYLSLKLFVALTSSFFAHGACCLTTGGNRTG